MKSKSTNFVGFCKLQTWFVNFVTGDIENVANVSPFQFPLQIARTCALYKPDFVDFFVAELVSWVLAICSTKVFL